MKNTLLFLLLLPFLSSFTSLHKFYVSVTEIEYNEKEQSLQIISRVFIDDLEDVLKKRYNQDIKLGVRDETPGVRDHLEKYLQQKLNIQVNGKSVHLNYLGKEYENDMVLLYLEVPDVEDFKNIKVKNSVLMDLYEDQKNLIHVENRNVTKSMILISGKDENVLNFKH